MLQLLPISEMFSSQMLAIRDLLVRRLMSKFQGDIESRGGSVALNSSAVSGGVSGTSRSGISKNRICACMKLCTRERAVQAAKVEGGNARAGTALRLGASPGLRRQLRL